jgi:hypothetical protein
MQTTNTVILGALVVLVIVIVAVSLLVWDGSIEGSLYMAAVISPIVGGIIGFVAGTKGVQQGSAATASPPPGA